MAQDLNFILLWWLFIGLFGLASLPITTKYFSKFWDLGYIFSKTIGWILISYLAFALSVFKILPFNQQGIWLLLVLWSGYNWLFIYKKDKEIQSKISANIKKFIVLELVFLAILTIWSFVRGFQPDIEGLEKYMDWGFINTILRTTYFPPIDMWYAGQPINYYYFGHLAFALLTKISGIDSAITYNLSIATCAAFTFTGGLSIASNLLNLYTKNKKTIITTTLISALILTFGGNLHPVYKIAKLYDEKKNLTEAINSYWYPDATRFIGFDPDTKDKTIHEFPAYSFIVSDLHGHVNDIPIVLLMVALLLNTYTFIKDPKKNDKKIKLIDWTLVLPYGFLLSAAYMTNAWDFAVYGLLFAISTSLLYLKNFSLQDAAKKVIANGIIVVGLKYLFNMPFSINFIPMVEGVNLSDSHSPFYQLFILYGGFWLCIVPLIFLIIFSFLKKTKFKISTADLFALGLFITATLLIIVPEVIYLKDIYIYDHRRANTMFKLTYQGFMMYSLIFGYAFARVSQFLSKKISLIYKIIVLLIFVIHIMYQFFSLKGYYGIWFESDKKINIKEYKGLYGGSFLKNNQPDNAAAIDWLSKLPGQPVIVEASGDSYTDFNQISMATGLPTIQGWIVHEWLWRGGYDAPAARQSEVVNVYESTSTDQIREILQKYNVSYIIVGPKEIEKYKALNTKNFDTLGYKNVFQSGQLKIYQVK